MAIPEVLRELHQKLGARFDSSLSDGARLRSTSEKEYWALRDGERRFESIAPLARRFGAALLVGSADRREIRKMTARKEKTIRELIARLDLGSRGWQVVDHWEADLQAIGVATKQDPRRLVYVSTFSRAPGHFDYQCEIPAGPDAENYTTAASGEDADYETLLAAMEAHLG